MKDAGRPALSRQVAPCCADLHEELSAVIAGIDEVREQLLGLAEQLLTIRNTGAGVDMRSDEDRHPYSRPPR